MLNNTKRKYREIPKPVKASIWFIISNAIIKGISFFTLPIFSRLLTTDEYGCVSVYQSWVSVISIITTLTIWGGVFNVGMVKHNEKKDEMISSFQGMSISITFLFGILSVVFLPIIQPLFKLNSLLIICIFIEIMATIPFNIWATEQRYMFEYKKLVLNTVLMSILIPLVGVIAIINTTYKVEAKIISGLAVQLLFGLIFFIINQRKGKKFYSKFFWKYGFRFNIVLIPHYLSMQILNQSDRIMINNICGSSDAGIYSVAYNFAMVLSIIANGINSSLTPHIYQSLKNGNENKLKNQTTAIILIVAVISVGLIAFIPDVFYLLLPESYYPALKVVPPVVCGAFFLFLYPLFGSIEFYYEENKYVTIASVIGAVLNIVLNYIFINIFGYTAAAYTTLFCYMCFSVFHYIFMKKILKCRNKHFEIYDVKKIIMISSFVVFFSVIMVFIYDVNVVRWSIIALIMLVGVLKRKYIVSVFKGLKKV